MSLIELKNVCKDYQIKNKTLSALKNISFSVTQGELLAIVGESGSGKSSLMNIIGLLDRQHRGDYYFCNQAVATYTQKELAMIRNQKIGFVFQSFFLLPRMNVLQNVLLPLIYQKSPASNQTERAMELLTSLGVAEFAYHKPNTLSGGQQQRVAIARALITAPSLLLADEPTGALDPKTSRNIMNLFATLNAAGQTIIIITHDKKISERCHRVLTLEGGMLV